MCLQEDRHGVMMAYRNLRKSGWSKSNARYIVHNMILGIRERRAVDPADRVKQKFNMRRLKQKFSVRRLKWKPGRK
jgi:hypothetical protein